MLDELKRVDAIDGWVLLAIVVVLFAAFEAGRWVATRGKRASEGRKVHAANVLTGMLTLLAFFLGFSFGIAEDYFSTRRQIVLEEANAIRTAYLRSKYLPPAQSRRAGGLLLEYVEQRVMIQDPQQIDEARVRSERLHQELWGVVMALAEIDPNSEFSALFVDAINEVITLHESRATVALQYRLPVVVMLALFGISLITVLVMGHSAGLSEGRDPMLTFWVIMAISVALVLIIDLDRPVQRTLSVSQQALIDVRESLEADLGQ